VTQPRLSQQSSARHAVQRLRLLRSCWSVLPGDGSGLGQAQGFQWLVMTNPAQAKKSFQSSGMEQPAHSWSLWRPPHPAAPTSRCATRATEPTQRPAGAIGGEELAAWTNSSATCSTSPLCCSGGGSILNALFSRAGAAVDPTASPCECSSVWGLEALQAPPRKLPRTEAPSLTCRPAAGDGFGACRSQRPTG